MSSILVLSFIELILGVLINAFIGKVSRFTFRSDKGMSRVIVRLIGIFLVIDPILRVFNK